MRCRIATTTVILALAGGPRRRGCTRSPKTTRSSRHAEQSGTAGVEEVEDGTPPVTIEGAEYLTPDEAGAALADTDALDYAIRWGGSRSSR